MPGSQRLLAGGARQARTLVDLHAHAVAEPVTEVLAVAGGLDQIARDRVDLAPAEPRRCTRRQRRFLGSSTSS